MDLERKFSAMQPKQAEENAGFAELPPLIDNDAPAPGAAGYSYSGEAQMKGNAHVSGAFPAFGIAYPEQNMQNSAGAFTSAKDFSANAGQNSYNGGAEGFAPRASRASQPIYAPHGGARGEDGLRGQKSSAMHSYNAAQGGVEMSGRRYTDDELEYQAHQGGASARDDAAYAESSPQSGGQNAGVRPFEAYEGGALRQGFAAPVPGDESAVGAAHFAPSDYDGGYAPGAAAGYAGEDVRARREERRFAAPQAGAETGGYEQNGAGAAYYDEPYRQDYAPREEAYDGRGQDYDYAPQEREFAAPPGGYALQNGGAPQAEEGDVAAMFAPEGDYGAYQSGGSPQSGAQRQAYPGVYQDSGFAEESPLPFDTPYAPEDEAVTADFDRLSADASRMDRAAQSFPPQRGAGGAETFYDRPEAEQDSFQRRQAGGDYAEPYAEDDFSRGQNYPRQGQRFAEPEEPEFSDESSSAGYDDGSYGDELYDWTAPAAGASAPALGAGKQPKKGGGILYLLGTLLVLALGAGLGYWFFGHHSSAGGEPVVIRRPAEDYKVRAPDSGQSAAGAQEQSVTDGIGGGETRQKSLIDGTEQPVEMQKMEEQLPQEEQRPFDRSAVDSLVKTVLARAAPIHVVPGVRVDGDRKITAAAQGGETVLVPGQDIETASAAEASAGVRAAQKPPAARPEMARDRPAAAAKPLTHAAAPPKPQKFVTALPKTQTAAVSGGSFFMQISSQPSREAAEQSLREAKKRLDPAIAAKITIISAVIPDKGIYYRVRVPAGSREEAGRLCDDYKQAGGHCFVAR